MAWYGGMHAVFSQTLMEEHLRTPACRFGNISDLRNQGICMSLRFGVNLMGQHHNLWSHLRVHHLEQIIPSIAIFGWNNIFISNFGYCPSRTIYFYFSIFSLLESGSKYRWCRSLYRLWSPLQQCALCYINKTELSWMCGSSCMQEYWKRRGKSTQGSVPTVTIV